MPKLTISPDFFLLDGEPAPLLCGEIHYFRMDREAWEPALDALVNAGCNAVAYYVPWFVHQPEPDTFDFSGRLRRSNDLHAWIRLTQAKGLVGIMRPGPYVYAETTDLGLPVWFTRAHPEARPAAFTDGEYQPVGMTNYAAHMNPSFLHAVRQWLSAVMTETREYLAPMGNIAMIQLCNEIPGDDHDDENPENLGIGRPDGVFPRFLRKRYGSLAALNAAYHTDFTAFEKILPHELRTANSARWAEERLLFDYGFYYPEYFRVLRDMLGPLPGEVTLFHNAYNPKAISLHLDNHKQNPWLNVGVDCYYSMKGHLTMSEGIYFNDYGAEYARAGLRNPPWVIEQECGYWNDYPKVFGPELYIWNIWSFAAGYKGVNLYLFAAGENDPGMGYFGTYHGWQAPVDKSGRPARTYPYIARALSDIRRDFAVFSAPNRTDIAFGMPQSGLIWRPEMNAAVTAYETLVTCGFTPRMTDMTGDLTGIPALWVTSGSRMPEAVQRALVRYLAGGGHLLLQGCLPYLDEYGAPCLILADCLKLRPEPFAWAESLQSKLLYEGREICLSQEVQRITGEMRVLAVNSEHKPAILEALHGGRATVFAYPLQLKFRDTALLCGEILARAGLYPIVSGAEHLRVIPKENGQLVVINPCPEELEDSFTVDGRSHTICLPPYSYRIVDG